MAKRRRHTPDQITRKLAEGNKALAGAPRSPARGGGCVSSRLPAVIESNQTEQLTRMRTLQKELCGPSREREGCRGLPDLDAGSN